MIRPVGIGEVDRAAGEGVSLQRRPNGICQVRAGFDLNRCIRCPGDDETESVGSDAKAGAEV